MITTDIILIGSNSPHDFVIEPVYKLTRCLHYLFYHFVIRRCISLITPLPTGEQGLKLLVGFFYAFQDRQVSVPPGHLSYLCIL